MYKLYSVKAWGSLAPHMLLESLGVPHEVVWMSPAQVKEPAFRKLSPLGFIPAMELPDGRVIVESAALMAHLTTAHPDRGLAPQPGSPAHGEYLMWLVFLSANVYGSINLAGHGQQYALNAEAEAHMAQAAGREERRLWEIIERHLAARGPCLLGAEISAADYYLFMIALWSKPSRAALFAACPHVAALCDKVGGLPHLQRVFAAHGL